MSNFLDSLASDHSERLDYLELLAESEYSLSLFGVYCLHTGKQIGDFSRDVILDAMYEESADDTDDESLVDALMVRVIASMRPSPALNKPDRLTLANIALKRPVDCLAFLVNRLVGNRDLLTRRNGETSLSAMIARIGVHKQWTGLAAEGVDLSGWTHWLLELDAKMNLHDLTPPMIKVGEFHVPIFSQVTKDNAAELLKLFESWTFDKLEDFDKRDSQALRQAHWARGNSFTREAYKESWFNNSNVVQRKAEHENAKKPKTRGRPVSPKTAEKNAKVNQFLGLLDAILAGDTTVTQPTIAPAKPKNLLYGNRLNFKVKESS